MRKVFQSLLWVGAASFVTLSCSRIQEEPALVADPVEQGGTADFYMQVKAGDPATKTVIDDQGESYDILWQAGDALGVFEVGNGIVQPKVSSQPLTSPAATATFGLSLSGEAEAPYDYSFVYPASALSKEGEKYLITLPGSQTFPANSFDLRADILLAEHQHFASERPTELNARFARLGATARMVLKAPATEQRIQRITFSTTEAMLHGAYSLNPATGELSDGFESGGMSLELVPAQATTFDGQIVVWFRLGAVTLTDNFTVSVRTETMTYTKTVNLASAGRSLEFADGKLTKFNVNLTEVAGVENAYEGSYAEFTASDAFANGITSNTYTDLTPFTKMHGDRWSGKINYSAGSFGLNTDADKYLQLPTFSEEIDRVVVTLTSAYVRTLSLTSTSSGTPGDPYQSVVANAGAGEYVLNVNSQHLHTAFLRVSGGAVSIAKVAVITKNDGRTALDAPTDVSARLDEHVKNTVHLAWTGTENAAAYRVAYTPEGGEATSVTVADEAITLEGLDYGTTYSYSVTALANLYFQQHSAPTVGAAFTTGAQPAGMKIDVITVAQTSATSTTYADFSGLALNSLARYAGKNAKGNGVIQLNNNNDNSYGIWSTASGGYVRSVTVTLLAGTANTLDIYAKNTPYESGDLYESGSAKRGDKVGSITASSEPVRQKIILSSNYNYVGIRSRSGVIYASEIRIEWAESGLPQANVATSPVTNIDAVNATLSGSYSNAANGILEAGFYWDTNEADLHNLAHPEQFVVAKDSDVATSGNFSCTLPSLSEQTTYYVKAYVVEFDTSTQTYVEHYGPIVNFTTLSKAAFTPGGWLEMPSYTVENMAGTTTSALNDLYTVTHYATMAGKKARNYSMLYDPAMYASYWVAYPLCRDHLGAGRDEDWGFDPVVPQAKQTSVYKGYGVNVASESYANQLYARGHQLANADRNGVPEMMAQTYYSTNMTPQLQHGFNGGVWAHLEEAVRSVVSNNADTVYVVTGAAFRKKGGNEIVRTITNTRDGKVLPVPNYYWKVLLKVKWNAGSVVGASTIGFWLEHRDNYDNGSTNYLPYVTSVDQIEEWTGFDFFTHLAVQFQTTAETATDWAAFKSY
ncbi:MAG: DNA/RNA non-specific endonuclease [Bacteroidales bacterium]|nr:DNA/RNA non-specific endonuclease [Bacteroidales bacterium]